MNFAEPAEGQTVRCSLCGVPYAECPHVPCQSCGRATDTDLCYECQTADLPPRVAFQPDSVSSDARERFHAGS